MVTVGLEYIRCVEDKKKRTSSYICDRSNWFFDKKNIDYIAR